MSTDEQLRSAEHLLHAQPSDEEIERLTGVTLLEILSIRAAAASAPFAALRSAKRLRGAKRSLGARYGDREGA